MGDKLDYAYISGYKRIGIELYMDLGDTKWSEWLYYKGKEW